MWLAAALIRDEISTVTHHTRQGLIVIFIFFGPVLIYAAFLMDKTARQNRAAGLLSVQTGMHSCYRELLASKSNEAAQGTLSISPKEIWAVFSNNWTEHKFSTFISPELIFLAKEPVKLKSPQLLCATMTNRESGFGIDRYGETKNLSREEIERWPHVSADVALRSSQK